MSLPEETRSNDEEGFEHRVVVGVSLSGLIVLKGLLWFAHAVGQQEKAVEIQADRVQVACDAVHARLVAAEDAAEAVRAAALLNALGRCGQDRAVSSVLGCRRPPTYRSRSDRCDGEGRSADATHPLLVPASTAIATAAERKRRGKIVGSRLA